MRYWLMKSEPSDYSIDDLARDGTASWWGVRNYQARNFMRDDMRVGDRALFYHSSCAEPGIVGIAEVCAPAHPDLTQFDRKSKYYDPASTRENPRWLNVDVRFVRETRLVTLDELRRHRVDGLRHGPAQGHPFPGEHIVAVLGLPAFAGFGQVNAHRRIDQLVAGRVPVVDGGAVHEWLERRPRLALALAHMVVLEVLEVYAAHPGLYLAGMGIHAHQAAMQVVLGIP